MRPIKTPPSKSPIPTQPQQPEKAESPKTTSRLIPLGAAACVTYNRVSWLLRVRKEVFSPSEPLGPPTALHLIFCQIVGDVYGLTPCLRLTQNEKRAGVNMLSGYGVTAENFNNSHRANIKRNVIELARTWPLYFSRLFPVSGAAQVSRFLHQKLEIYRYLHHVSLNILSILHLPPFYSSSNSFLNLFCIQNHFMSKSKTLLTTLTIASVGNAINGDRYDRKLTNWLKIWSFFHYPFYSSLFLPDVFNWYSYLLSLLYISFSYLFGTRTI